MIGNDIIDLTLAGKESNWKRAGFLDKIFTKKEQLMILNVQNPEHMVWNLWSRKEAAYKIYNRQTGIRAFIPLQLECFDLKTSNGILYGKVVCNSNIYFTKTEMSAQHIHTIAVTKMEDFDVVQYIENTLNIQKTNGIPNWVDNEKLVLKPMSISHHGKFTRRIGFI